MDDGGVPNTYGSSLMLLYLTTITSAAMYIVDRRSRNRYWTHLIYGQLSVSALLLISALEQVPAILSQLLEGFLESSQPILHLAFLLLLLLCSRCSRCRPDLRKAQLEDTEHGVLASCRHQSL